VLFAPQWIRGVSWLDMTVSVELTRHAVKDALPYDPATPPNREQETRLYKHHGRPGYWADEVNLENPEYRTAGRASVAAPQAHTASARPPI
jgi:hypothetical protein